MVKKGLNLEKKIKDGMVAIIGELSYAGSKYGKISEGYDAQFGSHNWDIGWYIDGEIAPREKAIQLYEDAYFHFLEKNSEVLNWLVNTASDVYDLDPSNVNSGYDYKIQECDAVHLQDIAIRNALKRLNKRFKGDHLVEIRGHKSEGYALNPGKVPFHKPRLIPNTTQNGFWDDCSIEDFYQKTKALVVDPEFLFLKPFMRSEDGLYMEADKLNFYFSKFNNSKLLTWSKGRQIRKLYNDHRSQYKKIKNRESKPYSLIMDQDMK